MHYFFRSHSFARNKNVLSTRCAVFMIKKIVIEIGGASFPGYLLCCTILLPLGTYIYMVRLIMFARYYGCNWSIMRRTELSGRKSLAIAFQTKAIRSTTLCIKYNANVLLITIFNESKRIFFAGNWSNIVTTYHFLLNISVVKTLKDSKKIHFVHFTEAKSNL